MSVDLNSKSLGQLPSNVQAPSYDPTMVKTGIVHIGPGAFFRGHIAVFVDDLLSKGDLNWGISAVSLKNPNVKNILAPQDYLYTVVNQSAEGNKARVIGSLKEILVANEDLNLVLERMTNPDVKLITLTVTQNGYYYDAKTGQLDANHPHIQNCLDSSSDAISSVGLLVRALELRKNHGTPPPVILSCDNFPGNGNVLRNVVLAYAGMRSKELSDWIKDNVDFPSSMVDRIVPKFVPEHHETVDKKFNVHDEWPIFTESYREWVIEDRFRTTVPEFSKVGVNVTQDVHQHELKKIRLLNGTHLAMGIIGALSGYEFSHEAVADKNIHSFIKGFFNEVKSTLKHPSRKELNQYTKSLIERLANPYMKDELKRLARNGSQKVPTRFISPIRETIAADKTNDHLIFAVAAWIKYLKGIDNNGLAIEINDPEAERMHLPDLAQKGGDDPRLVIAVQKIFGLELSGDPDFAHRVSSVLSEIEDKGMVKALSNFVNTQKSSSKPSSRQPKPKPSRPGPS